ncbi:AAA family ATPase [Janibacter sp. G368]|uniref:AAA family ATPase n=1 Tax=Janibacter sp. G368 TaxID=3420441 RepID=UPI003CFBF795
MTDKIDDILRSWGAGRNALLYGPPATGKTRLLSELFQALDKPPEARRGILFDPTDAEAPFSRPEQEITIPQPVKVVWTTFHQSYGYEDFVLGLRPSLEEGGARLQPWAGVFLDAALELNDPASPYKSVVIFIDEINRGNAARIFGEFMTFLDFDYRDGGAVPLPVPLRQLAYENGQSEQLLRPGGAATTVPAGFTFPQHVYVVATMNSVDRAAVPIDSALARRFDRIEMRPNLDVMLQRWGLSPAELPTPTDENWELLGPYETAYLLVDRLNVAIAAELGAEFELGHGMLANLPVPTTDDTPAAADDLDDKAVWLSLAKTWDYVIFPQLEDRYSGRPEQLMDLLHVDGPPTTGSYAWTLRTARGSTVESRALEPVRVADLDIDAIKRSLRWLTR